MRVISRAALAQQNLLNETPFSPGSKISLCVTHHVEFTIID